MAHFALRQQRMLRLLHRRAVGRRDQPAARQAADGCGEVGAGVDGDDAGHLHRLGRVDGVDLRVRMRRADEHRVRLAHLVDVVGVLACASQEPIVLATADRFADELRIQGSIHAVASFIPSNPIFTDLTML